MSQSNKLKIRHLPAYDRIPTKYDSGMKRVLLSWSSGKDSAWTLHVLRQQSDIEIVGLLTTLNAEFQRVAMHGVRRSALEAQADAAQLPLWIVPLPWPCSNEVYEQRMTEVCERAIIERVEAIAFGDLFLRDVRAYREKQLGATGLEPLFPLWEIPTAAACTRHDCRRPSRQAYLRRPKQLDRLLCRTRL